MIPIYKPYLPKNSLKYAHEALDSGWISSLGKYKNLCEEELKEKFGYKYVLLTNSGTSAIHLVSKCLEHKYPGIRRVIVPGNVYVAAYNAFLYDRRLTLWGARVNERTWNIDLESLTSTKLKPNDAILIVHNLGNTYNIPKLKREVKNIIVEDNCEGLGGIHEGTYTGTQSLCSSISFFSNKNITSGEGGAFCTQDEEIYNYANLIHGQGQSSKRYVHSVLGNNFRMTNIQAALLLGQLEIFDEIMEMKRNVFYNYRRELSQIENVRIQFTDFNCIPSNWMMGLRIIGNKNYEEIEKYFNSKGIETRPMFYPMHHHEHLKNIDREYDSLSSILSEECFMIPSYPELYKFQQKYIINTIKNYCKGVL
jgi:perosamine synthetase